MRAMILAAGLGERMRPLTDHTPKPLLRVADRPLLDYHLEGLAAAGFRDIVINLSHLGQQIEQYCAGGERWSLAIHYSHEQSPLETAGGIHKALPLLGDGPFLVVNGDVWTDYPFEGLFEHKLRHRAGAHLVFVDNPPQHPQGDFMLAGDGTVGALNGAGGGLTYSGIGVYSAAFFAAMPQEKLPLRPLLDSAIGRSELSAEYYRGRWEDVGTPERLASLDQSLRAAL